MTTGDNGDVGCCHTDGVSDTIQLQDGWTAKIFNLPIGTYYEVLETNNHGLITTTKLGQVTKKDSAASENVYSYDNGKITTNTVSNFTNTQQEGGLFVYKSVDSHVAADKAQRFDFTVALYTDAACTKLATNITAKYGDGANAMNFVGGIATINLADGEFAYATHLPVGYYFKAVEGTLGEHTTGAYAGFTPQTSGRLTGKKRS